MSFAVAPCDRTLSTAAPSAAGTMSKDEILLHLGLEASALRQIIAIAAKLLYILLSASDDLSSIIGRIS